MKYWCCLIIVFLFNYCRQDSRNNERTPTIVSERLSELANEINANSINFRSDSSQLTINIEDSRLMQRLLDKPHTREQDLVYLFALGFSQQLDDFLHLEYDYDILHLSFRSDGAQTYYFNLCHRNCD